MDKIIKSTFYISYISHKYAYIEINSITIYWNSNINKIDNWEEDHIYMIISNLIADINNQNYESYDDFLNVLYNKIINCEDLHINIRVIEFEILPNKTYVYSGDILNNIQKEVNNTIESTETNRQKNIREAKQRATNSR